MISGNVQGIMKAISAAAAGAPTSAEILAVLEALKGASGNCKVWEVPWQDKNRGRLSTLESRKPNIFGGVLGGRLGLILKPTVGRPGV